MLETALGKFLEQGAIVIVLGLVIYFYHQIRTKEMQTREKYFLDVIVEKEKSLADKDKLIAEKDAKEDRWIEEIHKMNLIMAEVIKDNSQAANRTSDVLNGIKGVLSILAQTGVLNALAPKKDKDI